MKKLLLIGFAISFSLSSCDFNKRYTQQSPEIDSFKKVIASFENQNWEEYATYYADTAKIINNTTKENAQTVTQFINQNKIDATSFSSWKFDSESVEYEMVVTDNGENWVNFWGYWMGTLKANDQLYVIPVSITAQFENGKIVRQEGYWDISKLMLDLQKIHDTKSTVSE